MPKIKNIIVPAVCGFILSFLISLLVTGRFVPSLLRGLIFGLIFAALALLIDIVYGRFLDDGSAVDAIPEAGKPEAATGTHVDLTVGDADLTDDGDNLRFAVNNNVFKLPEADRQSVRRNVMAEVEAEAAAAKAEKPAAQTAAPAAQAIAPATPVTNEKPAAPAAAEAAPAFQPITLGSPLPKEGKSSGQDAGKKDAKASARRAEREAEKREIDALPDLDSFGDEDIGESDDDDVIEDSEFAEDGRGHSSGGRISTADGNKAKDHDTETLAKAIRTILKRDE